MLGVARPLDAHNGTMKGKTPAVVESHFRTVKVWYGYRTGSEREINWSSTCYSSRTSMRVQDKRAKIVTVSPHQIDLTPIRCSIDPKSTYFGSEGELPQFTHNAGLSYELDGYHGQKLQAKSEKMVASMTSNINTKLGCSTSRWRWDLQRSQFFTTFLARLEYK